MHSHERRIHVLSITANRSEKLSLSLSRNAGFSPRAPRLNAAAVDLLIQSSAPPTQAREDKPDILATTFLLRCFLRLHLYYHNVTESDD